MFVRPLLSLLLIAVPTYQLVDVNAVHEEETGWQSSAITNKLIAWSLSKDELKADVSPLVKKVERSDDDGGVRLRRINQYPGSGRALMELLQGERQKADLHWRFFKPDGAVWEVPCTSWLAARERRHEEEGAVLPDSAGYVMLAMASRDAVKIDD